ncbi:DUF397 domain-containing protein [Spiractinospora alimapuensis]|uniref:DUF397 domain-containing protein n=1 Tax=Spiractinospora alimapuensis TaxID=2820884 RepID=UPI001F436923|nr:DUF397 domain-containing protein [Spiractinospora alimapuensis]
MDQWVTSSYTGGDHPNCVECRTDQERVLIRDTQNRGQGHLSVPVAEWRALLGAVRRGEM